ncbi:MAG: SPASM domain-containing protein [Candidatus Hydrogenedentes bacterium]|nr:SPASM domain-containing protein [Candidatus Hydrogenedentota bacterium]
MARDALHRFVESDRRFAVDPETCFCFECDEISWDVLEYYPHASVNRIYHLLGERYSVKELEEVIGELEWLRSTRAILPAPKKDDVQKEIQFERGLKRVSICLPRDGTEAAVKKKGWFSQGATVMSSSARDIGHDAIALLLGRAGEQKELLIEFVEEGHVHNPELVADLCAHAMKCGKLAGKKLTASVLVQNIEVAKPPASLEGHTISASLEFTESADILTHLRPFAKTTGEAFARLVKIVQPDAPGVHGRITVRPNHPNFSGVVEELEKTGFTTIDLDVDGAYIANPTLNPAEMLDALRQSAMYYAKRLLQHKYYRVDPIAPLFYRIYDGSPTRRTDPAGTNELAVDADGGVYPSRRLMGVEAYKLGTVMGGEIDEHIRARFDEVGASTTGVCRRCWARNLCGGGNTAVHHALTGSHRTPHEGWCDAQRAWMSSAVSAFNLLSSEGVNFTRVYRTLTRSARPSFFTLVRAMFRMTIGMRPCEEADAQMLSDWENWNPASYFLFTEGGIMLTTKYDREMDALHPSPGEQEMILIKKDGSAIGLIKLRPDRLPGAAQGWLYLHNEVDYAADDVRKGFRALLKEAGGQQAIRRLTIPAAAYETGLQTFLEAIGFAREGTLRETLFVHDKYHDVHLYGIATDRL